MIAVWGPVAVYKTYWFDSLDGSPWLVQIFSGLKADNFWRDYDNVYAQYV